MKHDGKAHREIAHVKSHIKNNLSVRRYRNTAKSLSMGAERVGLVYETSIVEEF